MSYTTITGLPERSSDDLLGSEYLLLTEPDYSYKVSLTSITTYLTQGLAETEQTLKNKIIDDITNYVHANAIHFIAFAIEDIAKGQPVKLVQAIDTEHIHVAIAGTNDIAIGVCENDVLNNNYCEIMVSGILDDFDTTAWTEGDLLYAIDGEITNVQPTSNKIQFIGYVLNSSETGHVLINGSDPYPDAKQILFDNSNTELTATNVQDAIDEIESHELYVTERLLITNDTVTLPYTVKGNISNNIVFIYDTLISEVITEYSVSVDTDNLTLLFDSTDGLNGSYCVVTYYK